MTHVTKHKFIESIMECREYRFGYAEGMGIG